MEYFSAIKRDEIKSYAATWIDLEIIILTEVRKTNYHITFMHNVKHDTNELIPWWLRQ